MKKYFRFATMMLALCLILSLSVSAKSYEGNGITLPFSDDYTVLTTSNLSKNTEILKALHYDASSLEKYMKDQSIAAIAVGSNADERFVFKTEISDFTRQTDSFNQFDENDLNKLKKSLFSEEAEIVTENGIVWMRAKARVGSETEAAYQYLTVQNGMLYSITYFGISAAPMETLMAKTKIKLDSNGDFSGTVMLVVLILISVACLVMFGILGISLWQDFKAREDGRLGEDGNKRFRIKRRHIKK